MDVCFHLIMHSECMENQKNQKIQSSDGFQNLGDKKPEFYRIEIAGVIDPAWSDHLGGLHIELQRGNNPNKPVTVLEGAILDQAQLSGILNTLNDFRYKLLSVKILEE